MTFGDIEEKASRTAAADLYGAGPRQQLQTPSIALFHFEQTT